MTEETSVHSTDNVERRFRKGTWPWFILNVILFPAPAHLTLLRVKKFSFGKILQHLSVTFLLFLIILASALLQLVLPGIGRLWMLFPLLSGFVVLYTNRSLKEDFKPFDLLSVLNSRKGFIIGSILVFTVLSVLPDLDLIELDQKSVAVLKIWITELPFWQEVLILATSLFLLFSGYVLNTARPVSINRALILYACYIVITFQVLFVLILASGWLKMQGGLGTHLMVSLLAAVLALDYWDAKTFGQYTRRYFFLTCTKGLSFVFLWLCFFGLPQKCASVFYATYYKKARPAAIQTAEHYLIFDQRDRFKSAHAATRRMRFLYTRAFLNPTPGDLSRLTHIIDKRKHTVFPVDADICRLTELIKQTMLQSTSMDFEKIPLFRPIQSQWDVMLTALLMQGTISEKDLDQYIAEFKTMLPKTSKGRLPDIDRPYEARFVSLATGLQTDFIPPRFEYIEHLVKRNIYPVLSLRLAGTGYWATLLDMDLETGIAWFRLETINKTQKSIQVLFDSNEYRDLRNEILSRLIVPISIDYLQKTLAQNAAPIVIFSKNGLADIMPDLFNTENLADINRAVATNSSSERWTTPVSTLHMKDRLYEYAGYIRSLSQVKAMLRPEVYGRNLFFDPVSRSLVTKGADRLNEIGVLIDRMSPLYDRDRMNIAYRLARNNHVYAAPDLFVKLAAVKPMLSDLIECREAFAIGRYLFLLGYHQEALGYLELVFLRHPFDPEYEQWYRIAMAKLEQPPAPLYSPPNHQPYLSLYYRTVIDVQRGKDQAALKRLEKALEKDSHDSLANHLLNKYFNRPLDERHFFPAQEGL